MFCFVLFFSAGPWERGMYQQEPALHRPERVTRGHSFLPDRPGFLQLLQGPCSIRIPQTYLREQPLASVGFSSWRLHLRLSLAACAQAPGGSAGKPRGPMVRGDRTHPALLWKDHDGVVKAQLLCLE